MSRRTEGKARSLRSTAFAVMCLLLPATAPASEHALLLDGAASSLLLDITRAGNRLVAVGERGHILHSEDSGGHWTQAEVPTAVMLTRVFFLDDRRGWAVGHDGNILASDDGGVHWTLQRDGISEQARINRERLSRARQEEATLRTALASAEGDDAAAVAQKLEEAAHAVEVASEVLHEPVYPPPLMSIWFADASHGWAAGAFGTLLYTRDGGRKWDDRGWALDNPEGLHFNGVAGDRSGNLYLASEWGYVFRSGDSGSHWEAVATGYDGSFFGVLVNPASGSVFAYGLRGTIYRSGDRGLTWQALDSPTRSSLFGATATADGELLFVGDDSAVLLSRDDGETFQFLPQPRRRQLTGVVSLGNSRFWASGEGGSAALVTGAQTAGGVQR